MNKLFTNLWFWVVLLHLVIAAAWYYLGKITPDPTYTEPKPKQERSISNPSSQPKKNSVHSVNSVKKQQPKLSTEVASSHYAVAGNTH